MCVFVRACVSSRVSQQLVCWKTNKKKAWDKWSASADDVVFWWWVCNCSCCGSPQATTLVHFFARGEPETALHNCSRCCCYHSESIVWCCVAAIWLLINSSALVESPWSLWNIKMKEITAASFWKTVVSCCLTAFFSVFGIRVDSEHTGETCYRKADEVIWLWLGCSRRALICINGSNLAFYMIFFSIFCCWDATDLSSCSFSLHRSSRSSVAIIPSCSGRIRLSAASETPATGSLSLQAKSISAHRRTHTHHSNCWSDVAF